MCILGKDIELPEGVSISEVSDGYHTFGDLYNHRIYNFIAVMNLCSKLGLDCGWSKKHSDGELCFGGGWVICWITTPTGLQARYHMEDFRHLPKHLERPLGSKWNGEHETIEALAEISRL